MSELQLGFFGVGDASIDHGAAPERTELDGTGWVEVRRGWLLGADTMCEELIRDVPWGQHRRRMYQRVVDEPRLTWRPGQGAEPAHPGLKMASDALEEMYNVPLVARPQLLPRWARQRCLPLGPGASAPERHHRRYRYPGSDQAVPLAAFGRGKVRGLSARFW